MGPLSPHPGGIRRLVAPPPLAILAADARAWTRRGDDLAGDRAAVPALVDADTAPWVRWWSRFAPRGDVRPRAIRAADRWLRGIARSDEFALAQATHERRR